ncbi:hypothetical protein ACG98H_09525 [Corynebacterium sp. L4756]|uniref:hypothetical protein n=1 Tax=unclassified Corynebacterium TaxID=2624378 RepID=UPI00374D2412
MFTTEELFSWTGVLIISAIIIMSIVLAALLYMEFKQRRRRAELDRLRAINERFYAEENLRRIAKLSREEKEKSED